MSEIDTFNSQLVGGHDHQIIVQIPKNRMTYDEAIVHAAWLVAMAEPFATIKFEDVLKAVKNV